MFSGAIRKLDLSHKLVSTMAVIFLFAVPVLLYAAGQQAQTAPQAKSIEGTWQGTLHVPNGPQLRTVVKVTETAPNNLKVVMYSIDQGGQPITTTSASFADGTFKYAIQFIDGTYEGKMSGDGNSISGSWKQGPGNFALVLERATPETAWTIPAPLPKIPPMTADANPSFEVATIKPSKPGRLGRGINLRPPDIVVVNYTLLDMVSVAYNVQATQVVGGPTWMSSDKYDVNGKPDTPGVPSFDQAKMMLQKLLADRFQLKFHRETKKMSAYLLTVAKGGPKMRKGDPNGEPGIVFRQLGVLAVTNSTMDEFAQTMQRTVFHRPVVNDTRVQGRWSFLLKFTPDGSQVEWAGVKALPPSNATDAPPPLFTAIQEQIGLKLEAGKAPVPVLVIDHVEPPSPN
jgi:uncharacterized protein (TIGR03435 family)